MTRDFDALDYARLRLPLPPHGPLRDEVLYQRRQEFWALSILTILRDAESVAYQEMLRTSYYLFELYE